MPKFVLRRVIIGLVSLVVFSFFMFWLVEALIPGDFFSPMRMFMSAEEVDALREQFGVDQPIHIRWWRWLVGFVSGDFVTSTVGRGSGGALTEAVSRTVFVFAAGLLLAYVLGQWLGRYTGWRRGRLSDGVTLGSIGVSTLFPPFIGFVFLTFIGLRLRKLRAIFFEDTRRELWFSSPYTETQVINRMSFALLIAAVIVAVLASVYWRKKRRRLSPSLGVALVAVFTGLGCMLIGIGPLALDLMLDSTLTLAAFTVIAFGEFMLIMQSGMVTTLHEDYIGTARAKGLPEKTIRDRHAARNASLAVVARLAVSVPYLLTGLVIVERAVGFPGVGQFLFNAIDNQDIPLAVSSLAMIGIVTMVVRVVLDVLTAALDPRIVVTGDVS